MHRVAEEATRLQKRGRIKGKNGVRFTYPVSMIDLALAGRCAGLTPANRRVLASTMGKQGSESTFSEIRQGQVDRL